VQNIPNKQIAKYRQKVKNRGNSSVKMRILDDIFWPNEIRGDNDVANAQKTDGKNSIDNSPFFTK
jgi:hypothetical protein